MKRRTFLNSMAAGPFLASAAPAVADESAPTRWEISAARKRDLTKGVTWFNHEDLAFLLRRGGNPEDVVEHYEAMHDSDNIRRMAAAGCRYGRIHFYKGLGLQAEGPEIERTRRTVALMHQLGMKASLYMAGTMFVETFYREVPQSKDWEQRDQWGNWVPYTQTQTYRHYPCPNEPLYRQYLQRVLDIGVKELRADQIVFDNVMLQPEPKSCHCPRCIRAFHEFLKARYATKEAAYRRFGIADVEWLQAPEWDNPAAPDSITTVDDPVMQEWIRFRCESLAHHAGALNDYIKKLNPAVSVGFNIKGLYSFNRTWVNAVYHPLFAGHLDFLTFDTSGYNARIDAATGALVSQIRSYKMARSFEIGTEEGLGDELAAALHMAFNYEKPIAGFGVQGGPFMSYNLFTPFMEFFREYNDRYCTAADSVADVAMLRTWASMAYSISANWIPATLVEQVLIQYKVPFDLLHEEQIGRIGNYQAVILAGQDALSDVQVQQLLDYVRSGGTLVLAGAAGDFNERRERRKRNLLLPARAEGQGRIVRIEPVVPGDAGRAARSDGELEITAGVAPRNPRFSPPQWVLPRNHAAIYQTILSAQTKGPSLSTEAPLTTVIEFYRRSESREMILHFLNFDRKAKASSFAATVRKQFPGPVKTVQLFSPDLNDPAMLKFQESGDAITFTVPATRLYSMVVMAQ
ncbi:MAG TPA: beta-galactosidase [Verrucomicrobiae bacterium]|nr:beta-galactosidase [Verrucomicrobiae bacterium]